MVKTRSPRKTDIKEEPLEEGSLELGTESTYNGSKGRIYNVEKQQITVGKLQEMTEKTVGSEQISQVLSPSPHQTPEVRRSARQAQREKEGKGWSLKKLIVDFGTHKATYDVETNEAESVKKRNGRNQKVFENKDSSVKEVQQICDPTDKKKIKKQAIKKTDEDFECAEDKVDSECAEIEPVQNTIENKEQVGSDSNKTQSSMLTEQKEESSQHIVSEEDENKMDVVETEKETDDKSQISEDTVEDMEVSQEQPLLELEDLVDDYGDDDDDYNDSMQEEGEEVFAEDGSQRIRIKQEIFEESDEEELLFENYVKMESWVAKRGQKVPADEVWHYVEAAEVDGEECGKNTKVICPLCLKSVLRTYFKHHMKKTHVKGRYPCLVCNKVFQHRGYLTEHERFVHKGVKKVRKNPESANPTPGKEMNAESKELLASAKIYGKEDGLNTKVICPKCDKVLLRTYFLKHTQKIHSDLKYPCPQCDKVFRYSGYLSDHIRYVHKGIRKKSLLNKYGRDAAGQVISDGGQNVAKGEKVKAQCPKCDRIVLEEYLDKHLKFAHSDNIFPCDQCDKTFTCKRFLYDHRKYVHIEKKTQCEICGKMFKGFPAKEKHKKAIHSDIKRYQCAVCGDKFRTTIECNRHMYSHEDPSVFCYQCPKCERRFRNHKMMNLHVRQVHKRLGRLQCKWPGCDKILNDKATFKKHYCIHTGEKPNQCPLCERRFIQRVALKYHLKTQHKDVDYMKLMPPAKQAEHREKRPENDITEMMVEPLPGPVDEEEEEEETTTIQVEVPEGTDIQSLIAGSSMIEGTPVELTDSAIVSDLINIAQSSEGGTVPEALQHVFEGGNKTIVIYYQ